MANEFVANNCSLLGLSIDSNPSHIAWSRAIEKYQWKDIKNPKITFPIVADDLGMVAKLYGMLMPTASSTRAVRTVFFIDPEGTIRAMLLYPLTTGRNMKEIMRVLLALQTYDKTGYATPADWMPGESQILPAPQTMAAATQRLDEQKGGAYYCLDWYLCFTKGTQASNMPQSAANSAMTPANTVMPTKNNNDMAEIMNMLGAAGMINPTVKAPIVAARMPKPVNPVRTDSAPRPVSPPTKRTGGIMEQNRMLFDVDSSLGLHNDYMITRDYPNNGA